MNETEDSEQPSVERFLHRKGGQLIRWMNKGILEHFASPKHSRIRCRGEEGDQGRKPESVKPGAPCTGVGGPYEGEDGGESDEEKAADLGVGPRERDVLDLTSLPEGLH